MEFEEFIIEEIYWKFNIYSAKNELLKFYYMQMEYI